MFREEYRQLYGQIRPEGQLYGQTVQMVQQVRGRQAQGQQIQGQQAQEQQVQRQQMQGQQAQEQQVQGKQVQVQQVQRQQQSGTWEAMRVQGEQMMRGRKREPHGVRRRRGRNPAGRIAAGLAAACMCALAAVPVLAARVDPVYEALYAAFPAAAQFFRPVNEADEDNGIRMEVKSAYIMGNTAEIYLTMQDLTGDRIDGTTDLYDSYRINCPFDSEACCEFLDYEEVSKTASFLIRIESTGEQIVQGDKVTVSVREFLSRKEEYEGVEIAADFSTVSENVKTRRAPLSGMSGIACESSSLDGTAKMLVPEEKFGSKGERDSEFPVEGITLTGMGYVEGRLRVQLKMEDRLAYDTHGEVYLKDRDGNEIRCESILYFGGGSTYSGEADGNADSEYADDGYVVDGDYCEYVFAVPQEELGDCTLYGDFVKAGMCTEGDWQVTFPLDEEE